jgi:hypothetical protein
MRAHPMMGVAAVNLQDRGYLHPGRTVGGPTLALAGPDLVSTFAGPTVFRRSRLHGIPLFR